MNNVASMHSHLCAGLNKIDGVNARYIVAGRRKYIQSDSNEILIEKYGSRRRPLRYLMNLIMFRYRIKKWIRWADVVYFLWDSSYDDYDLILCKRFNKRVYIEWVGSDIRNPDILKQINPFYAEVFNKGYEYCELESSTFRIDVQKKFKVYGANVIAIPEMKLYISEVFTEIYTFLQRLKISPITNKVAKEDEIVIVHSPTAPYAKGTLFIEETIKVLHSKYKFKYVCLTDMKREDVQSWMQRADIFIDQIIIGGHGMAILEAMSYGVPSLCYILPELFDLGLPIDCPIVNVNPSNLTMELEKLLVNSEERSRIGRESREYVLKYHNSDNLAIDLVNYFRSRM